MGWWLGLGTHGQGWLRMIIGRPLACELLTESQPACCRALTCIEAGSGPLPREPEKGQEQWDDLLGRWQLRPRRLHAS